MKNGNQFLQEPKWAEWQNVSNPTRFADSVRVPWVGPRSSWQSYSARCRQGPPGWSCWWCCARAPRPPPTQTGQKSKEKKKKKKTLIPKLQIYCLLICVSKYIDWTKTAVENDADISKQRKKRRKPHLCLGHDEREHRVRSGALVIHPSCSCGTLLVAKVQPALHNKHTASFKQPASLHTKSIFDAKSSSPLYECKRK